MVQKAVRAIIIHDGRLLAMFRNKHGSRYFTLVGGRVDAGETLHDALVREVMEETGLRVTPRYEVFYEAHRTPRNEQHIFLCDLQTQPQEVAIQQFSEEAMLNKLGMNIHTPTWVPITNFKQIAFRTPQLHQAILDGLKNGFPDESKQIN